MSKTTYGGLALLLSSIGVATLVRAETPADAPPPHLAGLETRFIDPKADPCVDFQKFACSGFDKLYPIPADRTAYGTGAILNDGNVYALHAMLDKAAAGGAGRSANEQKIGDFYSTCMNAAAIDKLGLAPLKAELDRIDALKSKDDLTALLAHFQLVNIGALFGMGEQQDFKDARKQIAVADQAGLGLPERDYYLRTGAADAKIRDQYVQHVTNVLVQLGATKAAAAAGAKQIMTLETALAKASLDITSQRDPKKVYHVMPVADLAKLAPSISWTAILAAMGAPAVTELNVTNPDFFKALDGLVKSTDLDTLKIYLRWQLASSLPTLSLPAALDDEHFNFYRHQLRGQPKQEPRWKRCVEATDAALGEALGQVYVAQEFPAASKAATVQMVKDIEAAMDDDIAQLAWMSPATKTKAKEKLHAIANKIGYPDKWRDYSKVSVVAGDALGNALRATEFENRRQLAKIGQPVDRGEFGMSPPTVNAYYNPSMNDINFPAGILQPPFFDAKASDAVNYGHIGGVVGHELTHGFDDQGRQFDANGNLADWWTADDGKQFDAKAACEIKEYGTFAVAGGVHVNGKLTLGENTADNGGVRLAYAALLADAKRKTIDLTKKVDGYTPAQQFFLAYAQNWCGSTRPEQERVQVQTDPHSPRQFRVNGVVQNMPEFGQAFGCKVGEPMMPANACRVW
jgi:putative endopeptidase